jgi:hypothetical protein
MSDQQEFPDNPDDYTEAEHIEHHSTGKGLAPARPEPAGQGLRHPDPQPPVLPGPSAAGHRQ